MLSYKYLAWDGSQGLDLDADDILKALSDDVLEGGDLRQALRRLTQRGMRGQNLMGLQDLLKRLRAQRQQQLDQHNLGSVVDDLKKALEEILRLEKEGIQRRLDEAQNRVQPQEGLDGQEGDSDQEQDGSEGPEQSGGQRPQGQRGEAGRSGQQGQGQQQGDLDPEQAQRLLEYMQRMAREKQEFLDQLPPGLGGSLQKLQEYDFWDQEAKQKYDELMEQLK